MVEDLLESYPEMRAEMEAHLEETRLGRLLFRHRCEAGLSQKELADRLGATQGTISKLEDRADRHMRVGDLTRYASALGLGVELIFYKVQPCK